MLPLLPAPCRAVCHRSRLQGRLMTSDRAITPSRCSPAALWHSCSWRAVPESRGSGTEPPLAAALHAPRIPSATRLPQPALGEMSWHKCPEPPSQGNCYRAQQPGGRSVRTHEHHQRPGRRAGGAGALLPTCLRVYTEKHEACQIFRLWGDSLGWGRDEMRFSAAPKAVSKT